MVGVGVDDVQLVFVVEGYVVGGVDFGGQGYVVGCDWVGEVFFQQCLQIEEDCVGQ